MLLPNNEKATTQHHFETTEPDDTDLAGQEKYQNIRNEIKSTICESLADVPYTSVHKSSNFCFNLSEGNQASKYSKQISDKSDPDTEIIISDHKYIIQEIQPYCESNSTEDATDYYKKIYEKQLVITAEDRNKTERHCVKPRVENTPTLEYTESNPRIITKTKNTMPYRSMLTYQSNEELKSKHENYREELSVDISSHSEDNTLNDKELITTIRPFTNMDRNSLTYTVSQPDNQECNRPDTPNDHSSDQEAETKQRQHSRRSPQENKDIKTKVVSIERNTRRKVKIENNYLTSITIINQSEEIVPFILYLIRVILVVL